MEEVIQDHPFLLALWSFPRAVTVIRSLVRTTTTTTTAIIALAAQMGTHTGLLAMRGTSLQ